MARRRIEPAKPLKRKVATRKPKKTLLIFCEGQRTEPEYLEALKRESLVRDVAAVDLRVETGHGGSVPLTLVALALQAQEKAGDEEGEIDEFEVAISNPCFELGWRCISTSRAPGWTTTGRFGSDEGTTVNTTRVSTRWSTCRRGMLPPSAPPNLISGTF